MKRPTFRDGAASPEYFMIGQRDPMRLLTRRDVRFELSSEIDTDDWTRSSDDPELIEEISQRLANEDATAWCGIIVTCSWRSESGHVYQGRASLWGCTLNEKYTERDVARDHDLEGEALADLNERLATIIESAQDLLAQLHPGKRSTRKPR